MPQAPANTGSLYAGFTLLLASAVLPVLLLYMALNPPGGNDMGGHGMRMALVGVAFIHMLAARSTTCSRRGQLHARGAVNNILVARKTCTRGAHDMLVTRGELWNSLESQSQMVHNVTRRHGVCKL